MSTEDVTLRALVPPPFAVEPQELHFTGSQRDVQITVRLRQGAESQLAGRTAIGFLGIVATHSAVMRSIPVCTRLQRAEDLPA